MENIRIELVRLFGKIMDFVSHRAENTDSNDLNDWISSIKEEQSKYENKVVNVVFAGEIKTGKSSLINSLLGEGICTVDSGACTNTNTIIKYGPTEKITVYLYREDNESIQEVVLSSRLEIEEYVSEKSNKNNEKKVHIIEVITPNELLKSGLVFIDTPGLGSMNPYHAATTFSIAPQADVFFMVSSSDSELTLDEKSYMSQLIDCSECKNLVHVVTNSDNGDPNIILEKNNLYFDQILKDKNINYYSCKVSNTNYAKYLKGEIKNLAATGFDDLNEIMSNLQKNVDSFIAIRALDSLLPVICQFEHETSMLLSATEDPSVAAKKKSELHGVIERLKEIHDDSTAWNIKLNTKISTLKNGAEKRIKDNFDSIRDVLKDKLLMDEYIKHPDKLGAIASAEVVKKNIDLQNYLNDQLTDVYNTLYVETGLALIKSDMQEIESCEKDLRVGKANVDEIAIYRSTVLTRVTTYFAVSTIVGGIAGALIGTLLNPGPGTYAGAQIGASIAANIGLVWGSVQSIFVGKEKVKQTKRDKIMSLINPELNSNQTDFVYKTREVITKAEEQLRISFDRELKNEIIRYKKLKAELEEYISGNVSRRNELAAELDKLQNMRLNAENLQSKL